MALQDIALPGSWDDNARSPLDECSRSPLNLLEKLNCLQRWSPSWSRLEFQGVPKRGEKSPHREIATQQFLYVVVIWWAYELPDSGHGCPQVFCWDTGVDALEQCRRILGFIEGNLTGLGKNQCCRVEIVNGAEPFLLPFPRRGGVGGTHEGIKEV